MPFYSANVTDGAMFIMFRGYLDDLVLRFNGADVVQGLSNGRPIKIKVKSAPEIIYTNVPLLISPDTVTQTDRTRLMNYATTALRQFVSKLTDSNAGVTVNLANLQNVTSETLTQFFERLRVELAALKTDWEAATVALIAPATSDPDFPATLATPPTPAA